MDAVNLSSTPRWHAFGWCGRLDLATKRATGTLARRRREVRVYAVATGQPVELAALQAMAMQRRL